MPYYDVADPHNLAFLSPGDRLPDAVVAEVPKSLQDAFSRGSAALFAPLATSFPGTYQALVEQCPQVQLLVRRSQRFTMMGEERFDTSVNFVVMMQDRTLNLLIPYKEPLSERRMKYVRPHLNKLPVGFDSFYTLADSFGLSPTYAEPRCDFPQPTDQWLSLFDFAKQMNHTPVAARDIAESLGVAEPFVFIRLQGGGLIVGNHQPTRDLFFVDLEQPNRTHLLDQPVATLDRYFARALLSPWGALSWP